jgi:hypothetical protein
MWVKINPIKKKHINRNRLRNLKDIGHYILDLAFSSMRLILTRFYPFAISVYMIACSPPGTSFDREEELAAIRAMLQHQEDDWNAGSIEGFMAGYWPSDSLVFISSEVTYGWDAALARYKKNYPDKETMGKLTFTFHHFNFLSPNACVVTGRYHLQRAADTPSGVFTLVVKKINEKWLVVYDHTS